MNTPVTKHVFLKILDGIAEELALLHEGEGGVVLEDVDRRGDAKPLEVAPALESG